MNLTKEVLYALIRNALYFLQHCHRHFLREGITLRYICDWAMFLATLNGDGIDKLGLE